MEEKTKRKQKTKNRGNGEGTIYYSSSRKQWVAQFTYIENGTKKRKSIYKDTRKKVADKLVEEQNKVKNGFFVNKSEVTLHDIISSLITEKLSSNKIKEATYLRSCETLRIIDTTNISFKSIQKIEPYEINNSLLSLTNYSDSVISKVFGMIKQGFNKALLNNIITNSPFNITGLIIKPKSNKDTKEIESLTIEEQQLLINELDRTKNKYKNVITIAMYTGMRIGEILALNKNDIDLQNNTINISKTLTKDKNDKVILGNSTKTYAGKRTIPIPPNIKSILENICKRNKNQLFYFNNNFISSSTINSNFKRICKDAGIRIINIEKKKKTKKGNEFVNLKSSNVNTHMLRHTYATRCIESGISAVVLQRLLGHKDIETTLNTYTSVFNKFKEDELQKLDNYLKNIFIK